MCLQFTIQVSILNQQNNKKSKLIFKGFKKVLWYLIIYRYGQKYIHKFVQHTGFKWTNMNKVPYISLYVIFSSGIMYFEL